jgi:hypothetical protein
MAIVAYQGLWNSEANSQAGYSPLVNKNPRRYQIKRAMDREGFRQITALFNALIGAATGSNVTATHKRVQRPVSLEIGASGGVMAIETVTDINRNTTAADVTKLKEMTVGVTAKPASYPKPFGANAISNEINPR